MRAFRCVCCLDGRIASRDADKVRSRRYRRNRRADRKAGGGKTSGRSLNTGGGIKRANSQRAPLFLPRCVLLPLCLSSPSLSAASPFERVTPSGFPLFTFIWIFLAARGPSSSHSSRALRKLAARALLISPRSLNLRPFFPPFLFFLPLMSATIQWF